MPERNGIFRILSYRIDHNNIWARFATDGAELTESSIRRSADQLLDMAINKDPDNENLLNGFWSWSIRPVSLSSFLFFLHPDTRCGCPINSHVEQYHPTHFADEVKKIAASALNFQKAMAAGVL